ncbi:MAG TPA: hypothetical protein VGJ73_14770 [Verrucomicrobiae bacterium]
MNILVMFSSWKRQLTFLAGIIIAGGCLAQESTAPSGPAKVELRQSDGRWQLYVNHEKFFVKGAGLEFGNQEKLAAAGGNSFRTWRTDNGQETGGQVLERAQKNGLYVAMGLAMATERQGFDYSDTNAVAKQLAKIKSQVLAYKDYPALLVWDIGNELNLNSRNPAVWNAVNDISKMIHQIDPNHPTTTSLAGINKKLADEIKSHAPDLDFLSIQSYADIVNLPRELRDSGWNGPYLVTEWGATGHWECGQTGWGAPIEDDSSVKAALYRKRYELAIASDSTNCLGSYVFLWGQKQERTPTWYGMFLPFGQETETVDVMQDLWTGHWPEFRSPELKGFWLDGKNSYQNVHLNAGGNYQAKVQVQSPEHATLTYVWEIMEESRAQSIGGDFESRPTDLPGLISGDSGGGAQIDAPAKPGAYRLFVYALDDHGKGAYANIPFYVDAKPAAVASTTAANSMTGANTKASFGSN